MDKYWKVELAIREMEKSENSKEKFKENEM